MRKYFTCVQLFVVMFALSSCLETVTPKTPEVPEYKVSPDIEQMIEKMKNQFRTCDKKDSEQPQVSNEVLVNKIVIEDQIDSQKTEFVDCKGKIRDEGIKPLKNHRSEVKIAAPEEGALAGKLNYVSVENYRTCANTSLQASADENIDRMNSSLKDWGFPEISGVGSKGAMSLVVEETTLKMDSSMLPIHEGNNVLKIRYFGKCLVYKEKVNEELGDAQNCEKAEELGSKMVYVELHVTRPLIDGINTITQTCR